MKLRQRARLAQKRRWRASLSDVVRRTVRRYQASIVENITTNNALYRRLLAAN